jgi:hypothetical protein
MTTTVLSSSPISRRGQAKGKSSTESGLERASKSPKRRSSSRSHCARDGHRFESPQLHQEVGANRPGFPAPTIPRLFSALARKLMVSGIHEITCSTKSRVFASAIEEATARTTFSTPSATASRLLSEITKASDRTLCEWLTRPCGQLRANLHGVAFRSEVSAVGDVLVHCL